MQNKMFSKIVAAALSMLLISAMPISSIASDTGVSNTPTSTTINTLANIVAATTTGSSIKTIITTGAAITLSKNKISLGDTVQVTIANGSTDSTAWVGLYTATATPGPGNPSMWWDDITNLGIQNGNGTVAFDTSKFNLQSGETYKLVLFDKDDDKYNIQASVSFHITSIDEPSIMVSKSQITTQEAIGLTITNGSTESDAWVGLYPIDKTPGATASMYYWYLADKSTGARYLNINDGNGTASLDLGSHGIKAGNTYKLVLFDDDKGDYISHASVNFDVVDKGVPGITLSKATHVTTQEAITVNVSYASTDPDSWLGIYNNGAAVDSSSTPIWKQSLITLGNGKGLDINGNGNFSVDLSKISNLQENSQYSMWLFKNAGHTTEAGINFDTMVTAPPLPALPASIKMDTTNLKMGDKTAVTISNGSIDSNAWIGIYDKGKVPGQDEAPIWYEYLANLNLKNGNGTFTLDTATCNIQSGKTYSLILFKDGAYKMDFSVDFTISGTQLLQDATLAGIAVNGNVLNDFTTNKTTYTVILPYGTVTVPTISALSSAVGAKVDITQAPSVNGTATIKVTALDGVTTNEYTVIFNVDSQIPSNPDKNANISNVSVNVSTSNMQVKVVGNISTGSGKNVIIKCLAPDGNIEYLDETSSSDNGSFGFTFTSNNAESGNYTAIIGGDGVQTPYQQTYQLTNIQPQEPAAPTSGGSSTPPTSNGSETATSNGSSGASLGSTTMPVVTKIDSNSNVIVTMSSWDININAVNVIKIDEPKPESRVQVRIPASVIGTGTGSFEVNTNLVSFNIPINVVDRSLLSDGGTLQVTESLLAATDASPLLSNIPNGAKTNGKIFYLSMEVCDSNNNVVRTIHNFDKDKSVVVTIKLTNEDLKEMDASNMSAFFFDEDSKKWTDIGGRFDKVAMTYTFTTSHFTNFIIMEKPSEVVTVPSVQRLAGLTRIDTSIAIAKEEFMDKQPDAVVLTTAKDFPDALTGSGLAYKYNAPLLLVNETVSDSKNVLDYITTNLSKNKTVYMLGGTGAVSAEIDQYLTTAGYTIVRLAGTDRYETNQKIVENLEVSEGTPIVITTGNDFADALSISSMADINGYPVLLNGKDTLEANISNYITNLKPTTVYVLGGTGVISTNVEAQIKELNSNIKIVRLGGKDRYETSMMIVDTFNLSTDTVTIATGTSFPDALSGSVLAAKKNSGVLLVDNKDITRQRDLLNKEKITKVIVLGGEGVISSDTATSLIQK